MKEPPLDSGSLFVQGDLSDRAAETSLLDDERAVRLCSHSDLFGSIAAIGFDLHGQPLTGLRRCQPVCRPEQSRLVGVFGSAIQLLNRAAEDHSPVAQTDGVLRLGKGHLRRVSRDDQRRSGRSAMAGE